MRAREILARRGGVILADDVGLGKSFVAAEIARELTTQFIVPASLVAQWRDTLRMFDVDAEIVTHGTITPTRAELVIVDEAHAFRNPATQRYDALARHTIATKLMLVTATPVCNSARDLEALIGLIARDDLLMDCGVPSIDLAFAARNVARIVQELVIRRDRSVLPPELAFGTLQRRVVRHRVPEVDLECLQFPLVEGAPLIRRFLRRRLESSEAAFRESIRRQRRFYERVLESGRALTKRDYRRAFGYEEDEEIFQQVLFWDLWVQPGELDANAIRDEIRRLDAIRLQTSDKREQLVNLLTNEPTLIFTQFRATARELRKSLKRADVLVMTDVASEGLNLQHAGVVIHYDLPWNPMKLEQRNGRAFRIGQQRETVQAIYFIPEDRGIIDVIARKKREVRATLQAPAPCDPRPATLRPRITRAAAVVKLIAKGYEVPDWLERRHCAGLERILREI
ncbi:MAG TPA: helicase-related protein [Thermoanaerobaculia bacterium]|nr:helicase-related protein [Thermoanaerobaculia bacterium]